MNTRNIMPYLNKYINEKRKQMNETSKIMNRNRRF